MSTSQIGLAFAKAIKDLCFPPACLLCSTPLGESHLLICSECLNLLSFNLSPLCPKCGMIFPSPEGNDHFCSNCIGDKFYFHKARSLFVYNKHSAPLIHDLKYGGLTAGLKTFARLKDKKNAGADLSNPSLILPIPLHKKRLRQRGFNQAVLLAKALFFEERSKIDPFILHREKDTIPQTSLSGKKRRLNLKGAFRVTEKERIAGQKILLIDDVFTTGTTVNECARILAGAGAARIEIFTLARVRD